MAKAKYWHKGNSIDYVNGTDAVIEAGTVVVIGSHIGVAGTDLAPGEAGSLVMEGVFKIPKGGADIAAGDEVYFNADSGEITKESTDVPAGYATEAAAASATEVLVKLAG
ncbi:MAG: DUF2190 family protein [Anaerotignum sp.]|nr:DUF2190 family protein [Anaerotignum sp.]